MLVLVLQQTFATEIFQQCFNDDRQFLIFFIILKLLLSFGQVDIMVGFWATVTSNCFPYAVGPLSVPPVCNVGVLWPNG